MVGRNTSRAFIAIYAVAIPVMAMSALGSWSMVGLPPAAQWELPSAIALTILPLVLCWRLMLYLRAYKASGGAGQRRIVWRIALAATGAMIGLCGLGYVGIAFLMGGTGGVSNAPDPEVLRMAMLGALGVGGAATVIGLLMMVPLARLLLARRAAPDAWLTSSPARTARP